MLATFVIGLREGLEAALIVGIIAAFLKSNGTRSDLRRMWIGVAAAVLLCIGVGVGLQLLTTGLPQRQQEMLECVIAAVAVAMVTFMILWMRQHARGMRSELEGAASSALAKGSSFALVAMAFLAVMREGFETAVFLLAAFQNASSTVVPLLGAVLGIAVALVIGWGLYRGAVRFNMARFFTITAVFLVLVAAGLVMKTFRAAYEAGWLSIGQQQVLDLSGLVSRGSIGDAVVGGVFGIQQQPVLIEVLAYLLYAVPMLLVVLWPSRRPLARGTLTRILAGACIIFALIAAAGMIFAPSPSRVGSRTVATVRTQTDVLAGTQSDPAEGTQTVEVIDADATELVVKLDGTRTTIPFREHTDDGNSYVLSGDAIPADGPATLTGAQIGQVRGRYPVGITAADAATEFPATYAVQPSLRIVVDPASHAVVSYQRSASTEASVTLPTGNTVAVGAVHTDITALSDDDQAKSARAVTSYADARRTHDIVGQVVPLVSALMAVILAGFVVARVRRTPAASSSESSDEAAPQASLEKETA